MNNKTHVRHIVLLVPPYSTLLDICGPLDVFQKAIDKMEEEGRPAGFSYQIHVVSTHRMRTVPMRAGVAIVCEGSYKNITYPIDTIIVGGQSQKEEYKAGKEVLKWLKRQSGTVRRICSVCGGAFILAGAGILDGRRAATHWLICDRLAKEYPRTEVDRESIFVKDGNVYTSAGITSGMDLALALIEEDLGRSFALHIARIMVLFLKRPGNQVQFSAVLQAQGVDHEPVNRVVSWVTDHLQEEITVEQMAEYALMSPRNFARVFVREVGTTPMKYVEKLRIETACRYLTETHLTLDEIATLCGFKNSVNMNRMFSGTLHTTPSHYRHRFRSSFG